MLYEVITPTKQHHTTIRRNHSFCGHFPFDIAQLIWFCCIAKFCREQMQMYFVWFCYRRRDNGVITSYSIHYTKLYEAFVAETFSDAFGNYRFDGLMLGRYYTVIAQDNDSYQYAPVSADRRKPEAYTWVWLIHLMWKTPEHKHW